MDLALDKPLALDGHWWLPGKSEQPTPGGLTYSPGGPLVLRLNGVLGPSPPDGATPALRSGEQPVAVIHGTSSTGRAVSLFRCLRTQQSFSAYDTERHHATIATFGRMHYPSEDTVLFASVTLRFDHLDWWWCPRCEPTSTEESADGTEVVQRMKVPKPVAGRIPAWDAELKTSARVQRGSQRHFREVCLAPSAQIEVTPTEPKPLEWYVDVAQWLKFLLTLLTGEPVSLTRWCAAPRGFREDPSKVGLVDLVAQLTYQAPGEAEPSNSYLTDANELRHTWIEIVSTWADKREIVKK